MIDSQWKNIIYTGDKNSDIEYMLHSFREHQIHVKEVDCEDASAKMLTGSNVKLVVINLLNGGNNREKCKELIKSIRSDKNSEQVAIFAFVDNTSQEIQEAFSSGVTDYITFDEDANAAAQKILNALENHEDSIAFSDIDITPPEMDLSKSGVRVFVVEDDPLLKNLLDISFSKASFPHEFNTNGEGVIPAIKQFKPDVVILDLMLPGVSGFDVLAEIKNNDDVKNVPVMVFSNRDSQEDKQRAAELGADSFYVKAMTDLSELVEKVEKIAANN